MRAALRLPLVLPLLLACGDREASPVAQPAADVHIALQPYFRELRTVRVAQGDDTLTLLFDTGGGATLVTPAVAARVGCRPHGRDVGFRMTGERVVFQRCDSLTIALAGWTRELAPVAVFDVNALLPPELPPLDGVLALDAFRGQVVTIDWPGRQLVVHAAATGAEALAAHGIPLREATGENGRTLTVLAEVGGPRGALWLLLDSGNLRGTLLDAHVPRDALLELAPDSSVMLRVGRRAPYRDTAQVDELIVDGVLGTDFLMRGRVALDLRRLPAAR